MLENIFKKYLSVTTVSQADSISDDASGVYAWYLPPPSSVPYEKFFDLYFSFYTKFYNDINKEALYGKKYKTLVQNNELEIFKQKETFSEKSIQLLTNSPEIIADFMPPIYVGKAVGKDSGRIKKRIKEEAKDEKIGGRIRTILSELGLMSLCSVESFLIKYIDLQKMNDCESLNLTNEMLDDLSKLIELTCFSAYFPPLNTKKGN